MRILLPLLLVCLIGCALPRTHTKENRQAYAQEIQAHRQHYLNEFTTEPRSPLKAADTAMVDFYPPDISYRVSARFELTPDAKPFDLPTYSGITRKYRQYGALSFELKGKTQHLNIYQNLKLIQDSTYHDYLFLPFKDWTNGESTYGGGRYMDFRLADIKNNTLLIDFNKAYNPYCAYSDGYNCPIPPAANHLELEITAGERLFKGQKKH